MIFSSLSKEQLEAVESTEGYVRVLASAGSGKTRALTYRYVYLVNELGLSTENIACITFTNKAAGEMKKRIRSMIGDHDTGYICTFHGMGVKILREEIHYIGWPSRFRILDEEDQESILKRVYKTLNITKNEITFKKAKDIITRNKVPSPLDYVSLLQKDSTHPIYSTEENNLETKIFFEYLKEQKKEFCLDFDDLVCIPLAIFHVHKDIEQKWAKRFLYVMVDEFQDVSATNYALCEALSGYHKNLFVVGDPDQLIYEWRGARMIYFMDFDKTHPNTKTIFMNTNYRSAEGVIKAANSLIAYNRNRIPKEMVSTKPSKLLATYYHGKSGNDEADFVSEAIQILNEKGVSYSDIAILYRAHYVSREFEQSLLRNKVPYFIHSGVPFYQRKEIKDILSYMRLVDSDSNIDFERAVQNPKRGIGEKKLQYLSTYAEENGLSLYEALKKCASQTLFEKTGAADFISLIEDAKRSTSGISLSDFVNMLFSFSGLEDELRQTGDDERLDNIASLKASIQELEDNSSEEITLKDYLDEISMYTSADIVTKKEAVNLMTIHAAKGLEYPYVFVVGMNEGIFPSSRVTKIEQVEEERRLAYVAFTRAKEKLFITESEGNKENMTFRYPSRFIFNVSLKNVSSVIELSADLIDHAQSYIKNKECEEVQGKFLFKLDDKVNHKLFGDGVVVSLEPDGMLLIKFDRFEDPRKVQQYSVRLLD